MEIITRGRVPEWIGSSRLEIAARSSMEVSPQRVAKGLPSLCCASFSGGIDVQPRHGREQARSRHTDSAAFSSACVVAAIMPASCGRTTARGSAGTVGQ
jgi:hypothetical protein